jgi:hypothetical protein
MWHRDAIYFNTKKFKADVDLLDVDIDQEDKNNE